VALASYEQDLVTNLTTQASELSLDDERHCLYYNGQQRLNQIGLAVPPELRRFETIVNWPRVVVDTIEHRQDVKSLLLPGSDQSDKGLMELWQANNLDSELSLLNLDQMIYGRAFMCVGTNENDPDLPLITVESPREITVKVDVRSRRIIAALRLYDVQNGVAQALTLYLPDETIWAAKSDGEWFEVDRDNHRLGRVPVVMFLNRRRTGSWTGRSEMDDIIPLTDAAARSLTNLQIAAETHSVPQKYVLGVSKGDFVNADGDPLPVWESYFSAIWANGNKDAKVGQFAASDLKNFHDTVNHYGQLASSVTGFPGKYFGLFTANPAAEGAIRADEAQMVKTIERKNATTGNSLAWVLGIARRLQSGEWEDGNRISVEWHDPGTPTFAQKADALQKLAGGIPIISREGSWDALGFSEARKDRERAYFRSESNGGDLGLTTPTKDATPEPVVPVQPMLPVEPA
jgi:SPP1 Gp6-like portal protein